MKQEIDFNSNAKSMIASINHYEKLLFWARIIIPALAFLLFMGAIGGAVINARPNIAPFWLGLGQFAVWLFAFGLAYWVFKSQKSKKQNLIRAFEMKHNLQEFSPLSGFGDVKIAGNETLWANFNAAQKSIKIPRPNIVDFMTLNDARMLGIAIAAFLIFAFNFSQANNFLFVGNSQAQNSQNIQIFAEPPEFIKSENIELSQKKNNIIAQGSKIKIKIFAQKSMPKVNYGNMQIAPNSSDGQYFNYEFIPQKSGNVKIHFDGAKFQYRVNLKKDKPAQFLSNIKAFPVGDDRFMLQFNAKDDVGIENIAVEIDGHAFGQKEIIKIHEEFSIDKDGFNNQAQSSLMFESAKSALVGSRIVARLKIRDLVGNVSYSNRFYLNIQNPSLGGELAQALQEIRLSILRENKPFEAYSVAKISQFDPKTNQEVRISTDEFIDHAPKSIQNSFAIMQIYEAHYQELGLDETSHLGLIYAIETLSRARNIDEAKAVGNVLWDIIEKYRNQQKDTKAQISDAIENLKQAIKNHASPEEIERLKQELRQAIKNHIEALKQQNQESGDMQIEDNQSFGNQDLEKAIDEIKSGDNPDNQSQKLDELNQFLQNMQLDNQGNAKGKLGNESGGQDLMEKAQELYDKTQNSDGSNAQELGQEQENLAQELKNQDENRFSDAINKMQSAAEALKNGDKEGAQNAQKQAIEALSDALNQGGQDDKDPLGRKNDKMPNGKKGTNGKNDDKQKAIIQNLEQEQKSREILQKLKEKANSPQNDNQEQEYYNRLLEGQ